MKHILKNIFILWMLITAGITAQAATVTEEQVAQIYVATFDRAPDADGLKYWVNSGLTIEEIAESFFEQPETKKKYPDTLPNALFVRTIYSNLFDRSADDDGVAYWTERLEDGSISRGQMILAITRGAQNSGYGPDKTILDNKTEVGLYYAQQGLNDPVSAKRSLEGVGASSSSTKRAIQQIDRWVNPYPAEPTKPVLNFPDITRDSVASDGTEGNDGSYRPSLSSDGRYVAFHSSTSNLVAGDTNGVADIFVHDRRMGKTSRVSTASDGTEGNNNSYDPSISSDGRYVAFYSYAANLVAGDTNGVADIFVHDRLTGETARVSTASDGTEGNNDSYDPSISSDGRYVAFESWATNLVAGDTNGRRDIFVSKNEQR